MGGPLKLGCLIPLYCVGCVVARLSSGLADERFESEGLTSREGRGISADDLEWFPGTGEELGKEGERRGVAEREREYIVDVLP